MMSIHDGVGTPAVSLMNITKEYGPSRVLGPVSVSLYPGSVTGIRGENGAGKSTLIAIAAGVLPPTSGERTVVGRICYVPQEIALYPALTCRENLMFWAGVYGLKRKEKKPAVERVLKLTGLEGKSSARLETCSGGMKRRLNLAAALLLPSEVLLLDEPTAGCDRRSVEIILSVIREEANRGAAVALVSHDESELQRVCDRVITLDNGLIADERKEQI